MKSGVAAMLYTVIVLQRLKAAFHGEIILFFDVDEERFNLGMKKYISEEVQADYAIIGEPTGLNICIGHLGCARFRLKTFGAAGHTGMVRHPNNAIYKMAKVIDALESLSVKIRQKEYPIIGHASMTVSTIKGGTSINIVPEMCEIEIDRRTLTQETREDVFEEIDTCVRVTADKSNFAYDLECFQFVPATIIDQENPLVERLSAVAARIQSKEILVNSFDATCEAPFLAVEKGIPTVIFGPGNLSQAHVVDEHVKLEEVEQAALILIYLAMDLPPEQLNS
jgi:acetylornithine deacetylase/succinyl-diaminopimelate desuccinylase-like protein